MKLSREKLREIILHNYEDIQDLKLNSKDVEVFKSMQTPKDCDELSIEFSDVQFNTLKSIIRKLQEKGYITYNRSIKKYKQKNKSEMIPEFNDQELRVITLTYSEKIRKLTIGRVQNIVYKSIVGLTTVKDIKDKTKISSSGVFEALRGLKEKGYILHDKQNGTYERVFR